MKSLIWEGSGREEKWEKGAHPELRGGEQCKSRWIIPCAASTNSGWDKPDFSNENFQGMVAGDIISSRDAP